MVASFWGCAPTSVSSSIDAAVRPSQVPGLWLMGNPHAGDVEGTLEISGEQIIYRHLRPGSGSDGHTMTIVQDADARFRVLSKPSTEGETTPGTMEANGWWVSENLGFLQRQGDDAWTLVQRIVPVPDALLGLWVGRRPEQTEPAVWQVHRDERGVAKITLDSEHYLTGYVLGGGEMPIQMMVTGTPEGSVLMEWIRLEDTLWAVRLPGKPDLQYLYREGTRPEFLANPSPSEASADAAEAEVHEIPVGLPVEAMHQAIEEMIGRLDNMPLSENKTDVLGHLKALRQSPALTVAHYALFSEFEGHFYRVTSDGVVTDQEQELLASHVQPLMHPLP